MQLCFSRRTCTSTQGAGKKTVGLQYAWAQRRRGWGNEPVQQPEMRIATKHWVALEHFEMISRQSKRVTPRAGLITTYSQCVLYGKAWQTGMGLHEGPQNRVKTQTLSNGPRSNVLSLYLNQWYMCRQKPTYSSASPQQSLASHRCPSILLIDRRSRAKSSTHSAWIFDRSHEVDLQIQVIFKRETF